MVAVEEEEFADLGQGAVGLADAGAVKEGCQLYMDDREKRRRDDVQAGKGGVEEGVL